MNNYTISNEHTEVEASPSRNRENENAHKTVTKLDFSEMAIYQDSKIVPLLVDEQGNFVKSEFIVTRGRLYMKTANLTERIDTNRRLTISGTTGPFLLFGSKDCRVLYIADRKHREVIDKSMDEMEGINNQIFRKDNYTAEHCKRVRLLAFRIALKLDLSPNEIYCLRLASLFHDLGKIDTPEAILLKEGPLTDEEMAIIMKHPKRGSEIYSQVGGENPYGDRISRIILQHHERRDGKGYPAGLRGEEISPLARILTTSDVYDALTTDRPYRKGMAPAEALELMSADKGWLDPSLLEILAGIGEE